MFDIEEFSSGLIIKQDSTKTPVGSARTMKNMIISDRGGIAKRPGTELLGTLSTSSNGTKGLYTYKKSFGATEIPMRAYSTVLEYYSPQTLDWETLETGYTSGQEFGFKEHLVNTENEDYLYFCNRTENYSRWEGATTMTNGALVGAETTITVDSVLKSAVFYTGTASSVTGTTITMPASTFATDQWNTFWVKITSGANDGSIALISDTTAVSVITFGAIAGLAGTPTFEIRMTKFPATGTIIVGGTDVAYTAIPTATTFTVAAAPAAVDNSAVALIPTEYQANPKGDVLETHFTRMIVGNVRSGLSSDGTNLQGSQSTGSYYVSKLKDATDFTFTLAGRVAGEGDIVSTPFGGGQITDIVQQEDSFYVFKNDYIESSKYSQDTNDIAARVPLKSGIGAQGKAINGKDNVYFVTPNNEITTIGRAAQKDILPQTANIGFQIKRLLDGYVFDDHRGIEHKDRVYFAGKESSDSDANDRMIVYNKETQSYEGLWYLSSFGFTKYSADLYYGDSLTPNVFKMLTGTNDVQGDDVFGITSEWQSNWFNLTASDFNTQSVNSYGVEGYISSGTTITFELYKDFDTDSALSFDFTGSEEDFIDKQDFANNLGALPLGIGIEADYGDQEEGGLRHFRWVVYFPDILGNHYSIGIKNNGTYQKFDITRVSMGITEDPLKETIRVKTI